MINNKSDKLAVYGLYNESFYSQLGVKAGRNQEPKENKKSEFWLLNLFLFSFSSSL